MRRYSPVRELFPGRRELSKLVSNHLVRHANLLVRVAVVDHETQSDEVGDDSAGAGLREDGRIVTQSLLQRGERGEVGAWVLEHTLVRGEQGRQTGMMPREPRG